MIRKRIIRIAGLALLLWLGAYAYVIYVFGCALTSTMTNAV